ncbi:MAG: hypothetical protein ACYC1T_03430 [Sulfuricaulis sp.]
MRSKKFSLEKPSKVPDFMEKPDAEYRLPVLPAYAIEFAELRVYRDIDGVNQTVLQEGQGFDIDGDKVIWHAYHPTLFGMPQPIILIISYHGIRSYQMLFPAVRTPERADRLAKFYEELDKTFDQGAWLSFIVMCGAVFEGLLLDRFEVEMKFEKLVEKAYEKNVITDTEYQAIEKIRILRNRIHLGRANERFPERSDAMDIRKILDDMIVRFSYGVT